MTHILHLGHQPADIAGIEGRISTDTPGFDPTLDVNAIRFQGGSGASFPFSLSVREPAGDLWLGFRYVPPGTGANTINQQSASFLEFRDADSLLLAQVRPLPATNRYHAIAHGDTVLEATSAFTAGNGQAVWIDLRVAVGAEITIDFFAGGVLMSSATAPNTGGKGKPRLVSFTNTALVGVNISPAPIWYYAHIAVLDGVSTIGRRFVRRVPAAPGAFAQMAGSVAALADGNIGTRVTSDAPGQRLSFTLGGPTGPAAVTGIAGVHLKQIVQGGTDGPDATAGFLRMGGVNHDATPVTVPSLAPVPVYSSWTTTPADGSPWDTTSLPAEVGILSA